MEPSRSLPGILTFVSSRLSKKPESPQAKAESVTSAIVTDKPRISNLSKLVLSLTSSRLARPTPFLVC